MYSNIGKKLKTLAMVIGIIEAVAAVVTGMVLFVEGLDYDEELIPVALLIMFIGPALAWISTWVLYGFGELVDKTCDIARNTRPGTVKSETQTKIDLERLSQIERLRAQGLITEEEYRRAVLK